MAKKAIPLSDLPVIDRSVEVAPDADRFNRGAVILMDKPLEWSSFDVVRYVRNRVPPKKVGHAGTLDPLATGLLILCCGKATKSISQIMGQSKTYIADIRFGASTPSYDAALEPDAEADWDFLTEEKIAAALNDSFSGKIMQKPPIYSAIKMKGERLYKKARRGEDVKIEPREVVIHKTEILECNLPDLKLKIECGKGTYIRSLAHDLGKELGTLAYLSGLRRTMIGEYEVDMARTPDEFDDFAKTIKNEEN
ncbi:MAG: tRNA pseudouridine(55) synthase TruB [Balneolaceae bacterium]|nr:tRNA pseudouridine(55) synthase TruB [Balneolaceae bacterium]MCH8547970.1 tRNA pseudouridine(55) synthase TruB [Balneolaceae bacterium]